MTSTIHVRVYAFGDIRHRAKKLEGGETRVALKQGARMADLLTLLGLADREIGVMAVNGAMADLGTLLESESEVILASPLAGGSRGVSREVVEMEP